MNKFIVEQVEGFNVVRDDLYEGGTKKRAFENYIKHIKEQELVYGCDYKGHASYAIALAAHENNKRVHLLFMGPKRETPMFKKVTSLPNVSYEILENVSNLKEMEGYAKNYADSHGSKLLPLGLDFKEFGDELTKVLRDANLENVPEIWVLGGTGSLARAMQRAYPAVPVKVVNLKSVYGDFGNPSEVFDAPEEFPEDAELPPPYPSVSNYDAKIWRFVKTHAVPGAYIWNVAA